MKLLTALMASSLLLIAFAGSAAGGSEHASNYLYVIATVIMVILAVKSWKGNASGTWFRLRYTGITVAAVLGLGWLSYWNLIGA